MVGFKVLPHINHGWGQDAFIERKNYIKKIGTPTSISAAWREAEPRFKRKFRPHAPLATQRGLDGQSTCEQQLLTNSLRYDNRHL